MRWKVVAVAIAWALTSAPRARAEVDACASPLARDRVSVCALTQSLALRSEALARAALRGRRTAVNPIVPSNPVVSVSVGRRSANAVPTVTNWVVEASQEIEIAGQRGLRLAAADADIAAEDQRAIALKREVVADALVSYFAVLGAHEEVDLAKRLETVALDVSRATNATSTQGLASGIDADVAEATAFRATRNRIDAEARLATARVSLTTSVGLDPATVLLDAAGDLSPLAGVESAGRAALGMERPDVRALELDAQAWTRRASTYRRSRVPNFTLSAFVQNDGFNEQVFGFGVAIPLPFPQPIGRTYNGEIAESDALAQRDLTEAQRVRRESNAGILRALAEYEARVHARDAVPSERLERASTSLRSIAQEISAGRIATRDAVVAEQALVDMLLEAARARLAACIASVEVARAASLPLERGGL